MRCYSCLIASQIHSDRGMTRRMRRQHQACHTQLGSQLQTPCPRRPSPQSQPAARLAPQYNISSSAKRAQFLALKGKLIPSTSASRGWARPKVRGELRHVPSHTASCTQTHTQPTQSRPVAAPHDSTPCLTPSHPIPHHTTNHQPIPCHITHHHPMPRNTTQHHPMPANTGKSQLLPPHPFCLSSTGALSAASLRNLRQPNLREVRNAGQV